MQKTSLLEQEKFWTVIKHLGQLTEPVSVKSLCLELDLSQADLTLYFNFMQEVGFQFQWKDEKLYPQTEQKLFKIQLNLLEWLQFQAHFPTMSKCENKPYHEDVKVKLIELEQMYKEHDLFKPVQALEEIIQQTKTPIAAGEILPGAEPSSQILMFLEESIIDRKTVCVQYDDRYFKVYPLKIVYFEGGLNLIAENTVENLLMNIRLSHVVSAFDEGQNYQPIYSQLEVDTFVSSLTAMHEKVVRLVLKIYSHEDFGINLNKIYFHNPCLFTNPEGDFIWAATLEPSHAVFEWLCDLGQFVEILDPTSFKREFLKYCEDKLKKIA